MQQNSDLSSILDKVTFLVGSKEIAEALPSASSLIPFDDSIIDFLNELSKNLMKDSRSKLFSDVITFAFWIRKGSTLKLKERFEKKGALILGKGVVFHIAPSNVPVNFAYTLVSGLLCGNANVVRVPSKEFPQVAIIIDALNDLLEKYPELKPYIQCVRYDRDKDVNDYFSAISDMRVVWGGDQTIDEIRKSPLPPRGGEITFADRFSIAVIDSDYYSGEIDRNKIAEDFYNDTFFTDQNACTSPRVIIWTGDHIEDAKSTFWDLEHALVKKNYTFQSIQGVNKLTKCYLVAASEENVKVENHADNLIIRVSIPKLTETLMDYRDNCGYFYEYNCNNIMDLKAIVNDKRCQTVSYVGDAGKLMPLLKSGIKGIDRVVPVGKTMDFDLIWDGYDLPALLTRTIVVS